MRKLMLGIALMGLGGCAMAPRGGDAAPGAELVGRSARVVTNNGQASTLRFEPKGRVRALFGKNEVGGRWWTANERLCFEWGGQARTRECWPYESPFRRGQTRGVTSDRGNRVQVTLL
jgi:hypothetical protein